MQLEQIPFSVLDKIVPHPEQISGKSNFMKSDNNIN
tara:strand:- start:78 stop:185 length:108 start_codon:yes stop_codon:yes gene_type:complete